MNDQKDIARNYLASKLQLNLNTVIATCQAMLPSSRQKPTKKEHQALLPDAPFKSTIYKLLVLIILYL